MAILKAGVKIYQYTKGFVHAKTLVIDSKIAIVRTANMDFRSFELNFEVNAIVYDVGTANQLRNVFYDDLKNAKMLDGTQWPAVLNSNSYWKKWQDLFHRCCKKRSAFLRSR